MFNFFGWVKARLNLFGFFGKQEKKLTDTLANYWGPSGIQEFEARMMIQDTCAEVFQKFRRPGDVLTIFYDHEQPGQLYSLKLQWVAPGKLSILLYPRLFREFFLDRKHLPAIKRDLEKAFRKLFAGAYKTNKKVGA